MTQGREDVNYALRSSPNKESTGREIYDSGAKLAYVVGDTD